VTPAEIADHNAQEAARKDAAYRAEVTLLQRVAAHLVLRAPWRHAVVPDRGNPHYLRAHDGPELHVTLGGFHAEGKLCVSGNYPRDTDGRESAPYTSDRPRDIYISMGKRPDQIARDIERRLLPPYLEAWEKQLAAVHRRQASRAARDAAMARIAAATVARVQQHRWEPDKATLHTPYENDGAYCADIKVDDLCRADLTLRNVPEAQAITILNLVYGRVPQQERTRPTNPKGARR
jgi:hypothetical protein